MKLKLFKEAEAELRQFDNFDKPEYFYQFHKQHYPNRTGQLNRFIYYHIVSLTCHLKALW